jgi:low density lipoprotein-related protein 2
MHAHCDGINDCKDGSDEKNCDCELSKGKFLCHSLDQCIDNSKVCDNVKDCPDGSDESSVCQKGGCKNLKCEYDCVNLPTGSTCICKEGFKLANDGKSCEVNSIFYISLTFYTDNNIFFLLGYRRM